MQRVGDILRVEASRASQVDLFDVVARSAYNRYYYAAFLSTRALLKSFEMGWERQGHSLIPDLLEDTLYKLLKAKADRQKNQKLLTHSQHSELCTKARDHTRSLASLLRSAYEIRVVADYNPERAAAKDKHDIVLAGEKLSSASRWISKAEGSIRALEQIRRELE